jgi:hypothetical protein
MDYFEPASFTSMYDTIEMHFRGNQPIVSGSKNGIVCAAL